MIILWLKYIIQPWLSLYRWHRWVLLGTALTTAAGSTLHTRFQANANINHVAITPPTVGKLQAALPKPSSQQLISITSGLSKVYLSNKGDSVQLEFSANWQSFADFINQLSQFSYTPTEYRFRWVDNHEIAWQSQLSPGHFAVSTDPLLTTFIEKPSAHANFTCPQIEFPDISITGIFATHGFAELLIQEETMRLNNGQILQDSWILQKINANSLNFIWLDEDPRCRNETSVAVAI